MTSGTSTDRHTGGVAAPFACGSRNVSSVGFQPVASTAAPAIFMLIAPVIVKESPGRVNADLGRQFRYLAPIAGGDKCQCGLINGRSHTRVSPLPWRGSHSTSVRIAVISAARAGALPQQSEVGLAMDFLSLVIDAVADYFVQAGSRRAWVLLLISILLIGLVVTFVYARNV